MDCSHTRAKLRLPDERIEGFHRFSIENYFLFSSIRNHFTFSNNTTGIKINGTREWKFFSSNFIIYSSSILLIIKKESFGICNYQFYKTLFNRTIDFDFIFYLAVTCIKLKISFYAVANE